jgi:hypothetical protein
MGGGANTPGVRTFGIIQFGGTIHAPELSSQTLVLIMRLPVLP